MAGKRHHFLPRFLLSGFESERSKKESYCWVYQKSGKCFKTNVVNVGVEKFFYGEKDADIADSVITEAEPQYSGFLNQLRTAEVEQMVDPQLAAEFCVHLGLRNRSVREQFSSAVESFFDEFSERISDPKILRKTLIDYFNDHPKELERMFRKNVLRGIRLPRREYQKRLGEHKLLLPSLINSAPEIELQNLAESMGVFRDHIRPSMKDGHNKVLSETLAPPIRVEAIVALSWRLHELDPNSLILGDFGAYAIQANEETPRPLFFVDDEVRLVALPISHQRLLTGVQSGIGYSPDWSETNQHSASLAREFFVSSVATENRKFLSSLIGTVMSNVLEEAAAISLGKLPD